ncbi:OmpA family protein [Pseudomonas zhanjiangensis]|uniref:OmpA family protein n=1 Tax=Pseudomonas zhanjiangensis TaxID=3239015 RepID=A0ABV3YVK0_9PSED
MFADKTLALAFCLLIAGCAGAERDTKPMPLAKVKAQPQISAAWLDDYEPRLREAIKDSLFELERRDDVLVVTAPVQGSFNPDRPHMLLPVTLGPISRVAKVVEGDKSLAVLVLGHADSSGVLELNRELSDKRARAFTAIFRLSGLKQDRLMVQGMGANMPRASNDSAQGRARNRRVEIILTPQPTLRALLAKFSQPVPAEQVVAKRVVVADQAK